jgi:hypothetical protein
MIKSYNYGGGTMHVLTLQFKAKILSKVVTIIIYMKARFPHKTSERTTPKEIWSGRKSSINHLCVFGYDTYAHKLSQTITKVNPKSTKCIFIWYH